MNDLFWPVYYVAFQVLIKCLPFVNHCIWWSENTKVRAGHWLKNNYRIMAKATIENIGENVLSVNAASSIKDLRALSL